MPFWNFGKFGKTRKGIYQWQAGDGFTEAQLDKKMHIDIPEYGGLLAKKKDWTLREIDEALKNAYCGKIGIEYTHIPNRDRCNWLRNKFELRQYETPS